jgi:glucose/arabinose dehydrogenase
MFSGRAFDSLTQAARVQFATGEPYHWLMVEKDGLVRLVKDAAPSTAYDFLNVDNSASGSDRVMSTCYECGLLGMAVDPEYKTNRRIYISYTSDKGCSAGVTMCSYLSRFTVTPNAARTSFTASAETVLIKFDQPYDNHNGGGVAFGPDGMLYASFGDGGSFIDSLGNAQNKNVCLGKILRMDVSGTGAPSAPADNPFVGTCPAGNQCCPLVHAYGLRNPWRLSFDRTTGTLWSADVGQDDYEEINKIEKGGNYGWPCFEASHRISSTGTCASISGQEAPVAEYSNDVGNRQSVTGGYVYRGSAVDQIKGNYIFGDFGSRELWSLPIASTPTVVEPASLIVTPANISTFAEDELGELYVLNLYGGQGTQFYKIIPAGGGGGSFPQTLSQTGCFSGSTPAAGLIPFDVNSPLWSDNATKRRWMALPNAQRIHIEAFDCITLCVMKMKRALIVVLCVACGAPVEAPDPTSTAPLTTPSATRNPGSTDNTGSTGVRRLSVRNHLRSDSL